MGHLSNLIKRIKVQLASNEGFINLLRSEGVVIGANCTINKDVNFGTEPYLVTIGDNVRVTTGVKLITHDGGLWVPRRLGYIDERADRFGRIIIGSNVNIGWNAIIMPGVTIGDNCIIGAGAVVTKDVPPNSVAIGVPARVFETVEEYAEKNKDRVVMTKGMTHEEKKKYLLGNL